MRKLWTSLLLLVYSSSRKTRDESSYKLSTVSFTNALVAKDYDQLPSHRNKKRPKDNFSSPSSLSSVCRVQLSHATVATLSLRNTLYLFAHHAVCIFLTYLIAFSGSIHASNGARMGNVFIIK